MKVSHLKFFFMLLNCKSIYSIRCSGIFFGGGGNAFLCCARCFPQNCLVTAILNHELYSEQNLLERCFISDFKTFTVCKIKIILFTIWVSRSFFFSLKNLIYADTFHVMFSFILQPSVQIVHVIFRFASQAKRLGIESTANFCYGRRVASSVLHAFPLCDASLRAFTVLPYSLKSDVPYLL